jgi:hypothetical protein
MMSMTTAEPKRRKFPWLVYWVIFAVIILAAAVPMFASSMAEVIARDNGCLLTDSGTDGACVDGNGNDLRPLISNLMLWGWMMILILPFGFIAALLWLIVLVIHYFVWRSGRTRVPS